MVGGWRKAADADRETTQNPKTGLLNETMSRTQSVAYRILDANLNRCTEGLRVVEDYVRFTRNDAPLSSRLKHLRHRLWELIDEPTRERLRTMRDVAADVGQGIATENEYRRENLESVVAANVKRVEQSLRSLEEYAKVVCPALSGNFESLRYEVYELDRALCVRDSSLDRLGKARLCVLVDGHDSLAAFRQRVTSLLGHGVDMLQLRDKRLSDRALLERGRLLQELVCGRETLFIMNDRVDLAAAAGADGVHLGQDDMPAPEARRILGPETLVGISTHELREARQAVWDGANYIGCGPAFPSRTKSFDRFPGLGYLQQVAREISLPAFAIGGVGLGNVEAVCQAGLDRAAVSGGVIDQPDPPRAARHIAARLREANERGGERDAPG